MQKEETRKIASELKLNVADKPDSQDICFVPNGDYVSVIQKLRPDAFQKGNIKNLNGKVIGVHDGIVNFTVGQRKGIKIAEKDPLYVIEINSENNEIVVGPKEKLIKRKIELRDINLLTDKETFNDEIFVKIRSTGKLIKSKLFLSNQKGNVELFEDEYGISPGQACVFYKKDNNGDKLLGGGWITN